MHRFWGLLFGVVLLACLVLTAISPVYGWWLPLSASSYAHDIDQLFYLILIIVTFFYILTEALLVFNMVKFGDAGRRSEFSHGNHKLEIVWSIVPAVILILIGFLQVQTWANIKYPSHMVESLASGDKKYLQLGVEARQWEFRIRYPSPEHMIELDNDPKKAAAAFKARLPERIDDIWMPNDVHVWKDQRVMLHFKTRDVGHSLFFPNLRLKQDALPGRTIPVWFEATKSNTRTSVIDGQKVWLDGWNSDGPVGVEDKHYIFDMVCTQYCGTRHSLMRGKLYVHPTKQDFMDWLEYARKAAFNKDGSASTVMASP